MAPKVRTRFAPSPTGSLHVGNVRIAVLNWLFTRQQRGAFILRIEDTDIERGVEGSEEAIFADLRWLGLDWDEGPAYEGRPAPARHGPYRQSERLPIYHEFAERLRAAGRAYDCYCTAEEIEARRRLAIEQGRPTHYDRRCAVLTAADVARFRGVGRSPALRFRVPDGAPVVVNDVVRGDVHFDRADIGDFILLRADGVPTYNFAVVVDDLLMEVTHVIRGAGHLSNTPRQILLYEALGARPPVLAHVPVVLGSDRQKLSKRHGAKAVTEYAREGYHPDALVNYLSLLSWSSPTGEELLTREQLVRDVSLERVGTADVVFDPVKLRWLSAKHIEAMPLDDLVGAVEPYIDTDTAPIPRDRLPLAIGAIRTHLATFAEVNEHLATFFPPSGGDESGVAASDDHRDRLVDLRSQGDGDSAEGVRVIEAAAQHLGAASDWTEPSLKTALANASREAGAKGRAFYEPLRLTLTGRAHGPPFTTMLLVQGRARVLDALARAQVP